MPESSVTGHSFCNLRSNKSASESETADFLTLHATDHLGSAATILAHARLPTDRLVSRPVRVLSVNFLALFPLRNGWPQLTVAVTCSKQNAKITP